MKRMIAFLAVMVIFVSGCTSQSGQVTNFEECIAAGNPAMESYPRKCMHNGETFTEVIVADNEMLTACLNNQDVYKCGDNYKVVASDGQEVLYIDGEYVVCAFPTASEQCSEAVEWECELFCEAEGTQLPNPAAVYCEEQGGTLIPYENDLGISSYCEINGEVCEEWEYFYSEGVNCTAPAEGCEVVNDLGICEI